MQVVFGIVIEQDCGSGTSTFNLRPRSPLQILTPMVTPAVVAVSRCGRPGIVKRLLQLRRHVQKNPAAAWLPITCIISWLEVRQLHEKSHLPLCSYQIDGNASECENWASVLPTLAECLRQARVGFRKIGDALESSLHVESTSDASHTLASSQVRFDSPQSGVARVLEHSIRAPIHGPSRCGPANVAQQVWPSRCGPAGVAQQVWPKQVWPSRCGSAGVTQHVWQSRFGPAGVA